MIIQTFHRLFPEVMASKIVGVVFANTTYTKPLDTAWGSALLRAIQKPILEPLLHLTTWLWPIVWVMNFQSYLSGSAHVATRFTSFNGKVTRGQLDFVAWFSAKSHPGVVAKGLLAIIPWEESGHLSQIAQPTFILGGDQDRLTLPEASDLMRNHIPRASLHIARCGHAGVVEAGEAYSVEIARFAESLQDLSPKGPTPTRAVRL